MHGDRGSAIIDDDELTYFHAATEGQEGRPTARAEARTRPKRSCSGGDEGVWSRRLRTLASPWRTATR